MIQASAVVGDLREFRGQLLEFGTGHTQLLKPKPWRPLWHIFIDWATIALAVVAVEQLGLWLAPVAIVLVGNRQRALGNILHDAAHQNLHRTRVVNDAMVSILVAPLLFSDLADYRRTHLRHHLMLGDAENDPDHIPFPKNRSTSWFTNYVSNVFNAKAWWASLAGSLGTAGVPTMSKLYIAAWWFIALLIVLRFEGWSFALTFLVIWWTSRATAFHAITMFREMCDHFGLQPGGVVSFTRDIVRNGAWHELVHPRNNGYHLTHHLLPAVPYYRLPEAQQLFKRLPMYRNNAQVFSSYILGPSSVVRGWRTKG